MENDVQQGGQSAQKPEKSSVLKLVMSWVGGATAVIGLIGSLSGGFHWLQTHQTQRAELKSQMAVAETQRKQGEYEASVQSYEVILKTDPLYAPALEGQLDAAMLWVENFQVLGKDDDRTSAAAGPLLDKIMPILDAGLARSKGSRAADVQAHLGWAHWLNWHIAEREFSHAAEQNLRAAVQLDKTNAYANAMLGNWMLQNRGAFPEAIGHLNTAVASGNVRPLVREMQIGGLLGYEVPAARTELVKAANDMRKNGEPLDDEERYRIRSFCYSTLSMEEDNLAEALSAVPEEDEWKTYLWLDDNHEDNTDPLARDFIYASLLDVSGKRAEALQKFRLLQQNPRTKHFSFSDRIDAAVKRLTKG
jgi:lipopolysaccharide biosynthesis regulator YciM